MTQETTAAHVGQHLTHPIPENPLLALLEDYTRGLLRMSTAIVRLNKRLDAIGAPPLRERVEPIHREEDPTDPGDGDNEDTPISYKSLGNAPRIAQRHDGKLLVEVTSDLRAEHLVGREVTSYVTLTAREARDALEIADVGLSEAAARLTHEIAHGGQGAPESNEAAPDSGVKGAS